MVGICYILKNYLKGIFICLHLLEVKIKTIVRKLGLVKGDYPLILGGAQVRRPAVGAAAPSGQETRDLCS